MNETWKWRVPLWCGMDASGWVRLLARNRFAVSPRSLHRVALISVSASLNTLLRHVQDLLWSRQVTAMEVQPPVFVIGHWRSGTSLLHELLSLDPAHVAPTTYECFFPNHFLLTENHVPKLFKFLVPPRRPMDNMRMSWDGPLEDEFAMCNLGHPSPYLTIAFPNEPPQHRDYLDMENVPPDAVHRWQQSLLRFLKQITFRTGKRIVLKSPPHSCRVRVLLELFPDARFVHIIRDPFVVFPSTVKLWRRFYELQGLQKPTFDGLEDYVFDNYLRLFAKIDEARSLVPPSQFCELRYEDLVKAPIDQLRAVYQHLDLGDFQRVLPTLRRYLDNTRDYKTNRYELTAEQQETIARRWGPVIRRYGYA